MKRLVKRGNVKRNRSACIGVISLLAVLTIGTEMSAQQPRYKLIDMGTFGGPQSYLNNGNDGQNSATVLNSRGTLAGWADTPTPDPFPSFCFDDDCFVSHAFQWHAGVRTDLGALTDGMSSQANWISASGLIAGVSENGEIDPLIPGLPELRAVLWRNGGITDLGTLPNGGYESFAAAANSRDQVVGFLRLRHARFSGKTARCKTWGLWAPVPTQWRNSLTNAGRLLDCPTPVRLRTPRVLSSCPWHWVLSFGTRRTE